MISGAQNLKYLDQARTNALIVRVGQGLTPQMLLSVEDSKRISNYFIGTYRLTLLSSFLHPF